MKDVGFISRIGRRGRTRSCKMDVTEVRYVTIDEHDNSVGSRHSWMTAGSGRSGDDPGR